MIASRRELLALGGIGAASWLAFSANRSELPARYSSSLGGADRILPVSILDFVPRQLREAVLAGHNRTDLTAFVQTAIDDGRPLTPAGLTYHCEGPLLIERDGVEISGRGAFVWRSDVAIGGAMQITKHIRDLKLSGFAMRLLANPAGRAFNGIFSPPTSASVDRYLIETLTFEGFAMGVNIEGRSSPAADKPSGTIRNCRIANTLYRARIGSGGAHGIYFRGDGPCLIESNIIENMQGGILVEAAGLVKGNRIFNAFEDNGIYAPGAKRLGVIGNHIERTRADGIAFNGSEDCVALDNLVVDAGNACLRVQASESIRIAGNRLYSIGRTGHFVRGASSGMKAPANIRFEDNICKGHVTANPVAFAEADTLTPYRSIYIRRNTFDQVDTTALNGAFFGPYAIVNIASQAGNRDIAIEENRFLGVRKAPGASKASSYVKGATLERDNIVSHLD